MVGEDYEEEETRSPMFDMARNKAPKPQKKFYGTLSVPFMY